MVAWYALDMTVSAGDELVEWVDDDDRVIGVVTRRRMRTENLLHRSVAVVVTSTDGRLLVHRRAGTKDLRPGWWDVCAGGVIAPGESRDDAARRELAEELGIAGDLVEVGTGRWDDVESREISRVYRVVHDGPYVFADGEVAEARLVTAAELRELMARERFMPSCAGMILPMVDGFGS
jgi:isopentenyldiphosphate isomerase